MKLYLAAVMGQISREDSYEGSCLGKVRDAALSYPYVLESYHYLMSKGHALPMLREAKKSIFLDSGAYTMFTKGVSVDLEQYADYIKSSADVLHVASNVDAIGAGKEEETYRNQKLLEKLGVGNLVMPVHHARDDDKWLQRYIAEGYEYIFLGGMVPESKEYLLGWLDHVWEKCLTKKNGQPRVRVHGFGLTTPMLMARYPWHSVDSTSWVLYSSYGWIIVDLPHKDVLVSISSEASAIHDIDRHYNTLPPAERRVIQARIEELGFDAKDLAGHYSWRYLFNIEYYRRYLTRPHAETFKRRERGLFELA